MCPWILSIRIQLKFISSNKIKSLHVDIFSSFNFTMFKNIPFNIQAEEPYREMVYFPLQLSSLIPVLISAIAITIVILLSLIFKLYRRPFSLMVLAINIAHFLFHYTKLDVLVFPPYSDLHCRVFSIPIIFGLQSAAAWSALFAHAFLIIITNPSSCDTLLPLMIKKYYMPLAVLLPSVSGIMSFFTRHFVYSETKGTCIHLIYADHMDIPFFVYICIPIGLACIGSIVWYKMLISKIYGLQGGRAGHELYVLMIYPGILLVCWGPTLIVQTLMQFGIESNDMLVDIVLLLVNMQGFFNALVYGKSIKNVVSDSIRSCLKNEVSTEEESLFGLQISDKRSLGMNVTDTYSILSEHSEAELHYVTKTL